MRNLIVVLGDQLNRDSPAFSEADPAVDSVWMCETAAEADYVWSHKARIAVFLSAMRHFRDSLRDDGWSVHYRELSAEGQKSAEEALPLADLLARDVRRWKPAAVTLVEPGEWRLKRDFEQLADKLDAPLKMLEDSHFLATHEQFAAHARGRKQLRMEYFYREMRRTHDVLMEGDQPVGEKWNYDADNRGAFTNNGPRELPRPLAFPPDKTTRAVLRLVNRRFADHPGSLDEFDWPVTPHDAEAALTDFIEHRLERFGQYQDAMWADEPFLYHSMISTALNLKLLNPRQAIQAAEAAYRRKAAPLSSVEGFVRQILGWREYVRGVYWLLMPDYLERNTLQARRPLPAFYWSGETEMHCLRQTIEQTLQYGYAHHIQRLMVTGLFALLLGVDPREVHRWYLAVYVDAVEWVELPNTLGMSQFADDGVMASKPYVASGKYIQRMSNYCDACRFDPAQATGDNACPFTTLYWDFLQRHAGRLRANPRMRMQLNNLQRKPQQERDRIAGQAEAIRERLG